MANSNYRTIYTDFIEGITSSKNYISNSTFENNSKNGWTAQKFTFSSGVPTGYGSPVNFSISPTGTNPLSGNYSLLLSNAGGTSSQYEGFLSSSFFVDRQDLAKVLHGSFSYEVVSGDVDCSGTSTQTLEIWIENVNTGEWIQPAGWRGMNQNSGSGVVTFTFQTDSNSANNEYRLAILTQQSGIGAYSVKFDNFKLGSESIVLGCPVTDWQSYNMIITATAGTVVLPTSGLTTNTAKWRRVGDSVEIMYSYQTGTVSGGTSPTGEYLFSLPPGLVIDDTKLDTTGTAPKALGVMRLITATARDGMVVWNPADTNKLRILFESSGTDLAAVTGSAVPFMTTNNASLSFTAKLPIVGWSSNVQFSNDTDTRVVALQANTTSGTLNTSSTNTAITFTNIVNDTHGSFLTNTYTIPVSGYYSIAGQINTTTASAASGTFVQVQIYNLTSTSEIALNSWLAQATTSANIRVPVIVNAIYLNAGTQIQLRASASSAAYTFTSSTTNSFLTLNRLSGPSVIAASETVACRYTNTAGTTITTGGLTVPFSTKDYDTHSFFNGATGVATIPVSGKYRITSSLYTQAVVLSTSQSFDIFIIKNGVTATPLSRNGVIGTGGNTGKNVMCSQTLNLNAGETIQIYAGIAISTALNTSANYNFICIERVGN